MPDTCSACIWLGTQDCTGDGQHPCSGFERSQFADQEERLKQMQQAIERERAQRDAERKGN